MRIKFLTRWRSFKADQLADIADGAANILVKRGIAVEFPAAPGAENVAGTEIDVDPPRQTPKRRPKPRPRKKTEPTSET